MQLASDTRPLLVLRTDHLCGQPSRAIAILGEPIEQGIERLAGAQHVAVGEHARRHARLEVAGGHPRRCRLEVREWAQRNVDQREVDDEAGGERGAEHGGCAPWHDGPSLGRDARHRGEHDEDVGTGELAEQWDAQRPSHEHW